MITLKRFEFVDQGPLGFRRVRINTYVDIPTEIDMSEMAGGGHGRYRLIGVIHHWGDSLDNGHYVADITHSEDGSFYRANDSAMGPLGEHSRVSGTTPYIVLYERIAE